MARSGLLKFASPKSRFGLARVVRREMISPHMVRITLASDKISDYPAHAKGGYIKLIIPPVPSAQLGLELSASPQSSADDFMAEMDGKAIKRAMRTYTVRHFRPDVNEIDVDFVIHGDKGIAGPWAQRAQVGDVIGLSGPGAARFSSPDADWFLVAADMTAFPAAAAGLEALPETATGEAWFEILSEDDRQPLEAPPGVKINWIVKSDPAVPSTELIEGVKNTPWRDGQVKVFVAGEFDMAGTLRQYFRTENPVAKTFLYVSSYWKFGLIESQHKVVKAKAA